MRLSKNLLFVALAIAIGFTLPRLPNPFPFLLAQPSNAPKETNASSQEKENLVTLTPTPPQNDPEELNHSARAGRGKGGILQTLNLSTAQKRQLRAARQQFQPQIRERNRSVRQAQQELDTLLASTASEAEVNAKFQQVLQLRQEAQKLQFQSVLAMRQILNPEQRKTFAEAMAKRRELRRERQQRLKAQE